MIVPVFLIILPVFSLVFLGLSAAKANILGPTATTELNRFVVYLALPALLFETVTNSTPGQLFQPGFALVFGLGLALIFLANVAFGTWRGRPLADATIDGLNAAYPNAGFMGFPLALTVLGQAAFAPTLIASLLTVCVLFASAIAVIEFGVNKEFGAGRIAWDAFSSVARNPIVMAPCLGFLLLMAKLAVPAPIGNAIRLLGAAASPCALVSLGLFIAAPLDKSHPDYLLIGTLVTSKLIVQPTLMWCLASVFHLSTFSTHTAVLLATLPTGTGPFMLAKVYERDANITSRVILVSTIISVFTITTYLSTRR